MHTRWPSTVWLWLVACAWVPACTVSIPAADHFPEAYDTAVHDTGASDAAADAKVDAKADAKVDAADAQPDSATDAIDAADSGPDDADTAIDTGADTVDASDAEDGVDTADVPDAVTAADAADDTQPDDATDDAATDAVDAAPPCTPSQCDDGNPCTTDECVNDQCAHTDLTGSDCPDDGLACTSDQCATGVCSHTTLLSGWCIVAGTCYLAGQGAADGCSLCDPASSPVALTPLPDTATCSDGTACTEGDHCQGGTCQGGAAINCDDGNPCTADSCDPTSGCSNPTVPDGSGCPLSGACLLPGQCVAGQCQSSPKLWSSALDGGTGGDDVFLSVATAGNGDILAVGTRVGTSGQMEGWGVHLNAAADVVEFLPVNALPSAPAVYKSVAAGPGGALAIGGSAGPDATVTLRQANGIVSEFKPFTAFNAAQTRRILALSSGWLAVDDHGHVARLTASGSTQWLGHADLLADHALNGLVATADGGALAVGTLTAPVLGDAAGVIVRLGPTGGVLWTQTVGTTTTELLQVAGLLNGGYATVGLEGAALRFFQLGATGEVTATATWTPPAGVNVADAVWAAEGEWRLAGTSSGHLWLGAVDAWGNLLWQKGYDSGEGHGVALLPSGAAVVVGASGTPTDGLVIRADAWGEASCGASLLCSNLSWNACDDNLPCTVDTCTAGACGHTPLSAGLCDDGDACTGAEQCVSGVCKGTATLGDTSLAAAPGLTLVAARADGGAVVVDSANTLTGLDAAGQSVWSTAIGGAPVTAVAAWPNGWSVALQGTTGGVLTRIQADGTVAGAPIAVGAAVGGSTSGLAVLADGSLTVVGTANTGLANQTAVVEHFDAAWVGLSQTLPGTFGLSQGLAIAASAKSGCAVLTVEGAVAKLHRLDSNLTETWSVGLGQPTYTHLAAMPDDGWLAAGLGKTGVLLERRGPDGAVEFALQWPIPGLTSVAGVAVLADGTSAVAVTRSINGITNGGIARFSPLGNLLSLSWGVDGSVASAITRTVDPAGVWLVGSSQVGNWLRRTDTHGGTSCSTVGTCISQSLLCDDGNPCTNDGCSGGTCVSDVGAEPLTCLSGATCTAAGACPLVGSCGDGKCNLDETSASCASDCAASCDAMNCDDGDPCTVDYCQAGACAIAGAPDGTSCAAGKACSFGQCIAPGCGDGTCSPGETISSCPADCPACGDGVCGAGENNHLCPADCAKPASGCQNMCGWKSTKPGGGVCWCDPGCTPGPGGDCCDDKATFCP